MPYLKDGREPRVELGSVERVVVEAGAGFEDVPPDLEPVLGVEGAHGGALGAEQVVALALEAVLRSEGEGAQVPSGHVNPRLEHPQLVFGDEITDELAGLHDRVEAFDALPLARGAAVELDPRAQRPRVADAETEDVVVLAVVDVEGPELPLAFGPRGPAPSAPELGAQRRAAAGALAHPLPGEVPGPGVGVFQVSAAGPHRAVRPPAPAAGPAPPGGVVALGRVRPAVIHPRPGAGGK